MGSSVHALDHRSAVITVISKETKVKEPTQSFGYPHLLEVIGCVVILVFKNADSDL